MTSRTDVSNMSAVTYYFDDILEKSFAESAVTGNLICAMRSYIVYTYIYR